MKKLLVIDALNLFIRNYVVNPSMDAKGNPVGGCIGFIKSMQKICRKFNPDEIVIAWDGHGGSASKKSQNKNYKEGRAPIRFNRRMIDLTPEQEEVNKNYQYMTLINYLNHMPVIQLVYDYVEADDVIAYVTQMEHYKGWEKTIVSSDKDFFQLVDDETSLYLPMQDAIADTDYLLEKYGIHPKNFAIARAIVGDPSDNLAGVKRAGFKTIRKSFEFLKEPNEASIDFLMESCNSVKKQLQIHKNILNSEDLIKSNYRIMQLSEPSISPTSRSSIQYNVVNFEPTFTKLDVVKLLFEDGLSHNNLDFLFTMFKNFRRSQ